MGYIKHNTIVVTTYKDDIINYHNKANEIFDNKLVSNIVHGLTNGQSSFFIAPDGSKEGWETSNNCDKLREKFLDYLNFNNVRPNYIEIIFGGDDDYETIVRSNKKDLDYE